MRASLSNQRKIFNDPVYGFISIYNDLLFQVIEHPFFQRLRRIKQLGLTHLVYPGALHTRFNHSLGAMYLTHRAVNELIAKGQAITEEEKFSVIAAILLHDIGHGPYSHTLEKYIIKGSGHENVTRAFLHQLNNEFENSLEMTIAIFDDTYPKAFLHKMVSSQLDMDRLDYLHRDSFFTGVSEGAINYERLLNMLEVVNDELAIEAKGIYSVERFITARRLMYWQVYLHKTVLVSENMLIRAIKRARQLVRDGHKLFATPALGFFLQNEVSADDLFENKQVLKIFAQLDDFDILTSLKTWVEFSDPILSTISSNIVNRRLNKILLQNTPFENDFLELVKDRTRKKYNLSADETDYLAFHDQTANHAYHLGPDQINILYKDGTVKNITQATENLNISLLSKPITKYYVCFPKDVNID